MSGFSVLCVVCPLCGLLVVFFSGAFVRPNIFCMRDIVQVFVYIDGSTLLRYILCVIMCYCCYGGVRTSSRPRFSRTHMDVE